MRNNHFNDLEEAFNKVGHSMYSDDFCCKLLAWLYVFGGGYEAVVINNGMYQAIQTAQRRLNLYGGEVPNGSLLPLFRRYSKEAENHEKGIVEAKWVNKEIHSRYKIPLQKFEPQKHDVPNTY